MSDRTKYFADYYKRNKTKKDAESMARYRVHKVKAARKEREHSEEIAVKRIKSKMRKQSL